MRKAGSLAVALARWVLKPPLGLKFVAAAMVVAGLAVATLEVVVEVANVALGAVAVLAAVCGVAMLARPDLFKSAEEGRPR